MRIAVLRGGPSDDYETSLESGSVALLHLRQNHTAEDIFIDKEGTWHRGGLPTKVERLVPHFDLFFNALHGRFGEDGQVARILDSHYVRYTGSGAVPAGSAFNRDLAKKLLREQGLLVPEGILVDTMRDPHEVAGEIWQTMGGQYVVKPVTGSFSRGMEIVRSYPELVPAIIRGLLNHKKVLVEERLSGRELKVIVAEGFRGQKLYTFLPIEADTFTTPARLSQDEKSEAMRVACLAHTALGLAHYSSVDIMLTRRGMFVLEVDALPPLGPSHHLSKSLQAVGATMPEFLNHIVSIV